MSDITYCSECGKRITTTDGTCTCVSTDPVTISSHSGSWHYVDVFSYDKEILEEIKETNKILRKILKEIKKKGD